MLPMCDVLTIKSVDVLSHNYKRIIITSHNLHFYIQKTLGQLLISDICSLPDGAICLRSPLDTQMHVSSFCLVRFFKSDKGPLHY